MFERIMQHWEKECEALKDSVWLRRLETGDVGLHHYKGYLQETYHHAGLNPQIQAYATMFFKENDRDLIKMFYRHATSEIGHDLLALNDLVALGENAQAIQRSKPLPETIGFNAFVLHQIQFVSPVAYLGYLFHLEFLPTRRGANYIERLKALGAPDESLTFLEEHSKVDVAHNELMKKYVPRLVRTEEDLELLKYSMHCSVRLHRHMIDAGFANGEKLFASSPGQQRKTG